ncbi:MAG: hypothetical protein WCO54_07765 [Bacteroidota bacterium]
MKNLFLITVLIYLVSCKDNAPEPCKDPSNSHCINYDPCYGKLPTNADFTMTEAFGITPPLMGWEFYDTDTCSNSYVTFIAKDSSANSYLWQIGTDTFQRRSVTIHFPSNWVTHTNQINFIDVNLTVKKTPDKNCFPTDSGFAVKTRRLYFICDTANLIKGVFVGTWNNSSQIDTVGFFYWQKMLPNGPIVKLRFTNTSTKCFEYTDDIYYGYREVSFGIPSCIGRSYAKIVKETGKLIIRTTNNNKDTATFNGNRI